MNKFHVSVLLKESIGFLNIKPGQKYIDATLGGGGHSAAILSLGGIVLGIDMDQDAIDHVGKDLASNILNHKLVLAKGNFKDLDKIAHLKGFSKVAGVLFDLGVSSHQIDTPERGFSFSKEGPLDMRMDKSSPVTAEALVNLLEKGELYDLFNRLGQESRFRAVSNSIISARRLKAIRSTEDLAKVVGEAYGFKRGITSDFTKNRVNKKVFQALRIAVNNELENLKIALPKALSLLDRRGRIAVISFHSLEDGIVKKMFKDFHKKGMGTIITDKVVIPTDEEAISNPRAKSAKLRVFEKN